MKPLRTLLCTVFVLAFASMAQAQEIPADMQAQLEKLQTLPPEERAALAENLSQSAAVMQQCISEAGGEQALEELRDLHNAHQTQVAALCNNGKREQAQAYAEQAATELSQDSRVTKLHECSRVATQNMPQLSGLLAPGGIDRSKHVCD